jgi:stage V sporulation protein AC
VSLIFLGIFFTAIHLYDNLAKHAGAGTLVPITGFANSISAPAIEFKSEGLITGLGAKMFVIAGPVLVYGTSASAIYGVIYYLIKLLS